MANRTVSTLILLLYRPRHFIGTPSNEFLITGEFIAMLDYYVTTSLSERLSDAVELRPFYDKRVVLYKALNGRDGERDWRSLLLAQLQDWLSKFLDSTNKRKNRLSRGVYSTQLNVPALDVDEM